MLMEIEKEQLIRILPYLRRYARALAGSQQCADTAVIAAVQSLSSTTRTNSRQSPRVALYRAFTEIWNGPLGQHMRESARSDTFQDSVDRKLSALPSWSRQAFLLHAVEAFTESQVSEILGVTPDEVAALIAQARGAISSQIATDVLIIEDELFIAADLEDIVTSLGHNVISVERTHASAVQALRFRRPGLILADIQLADGSSGLDAVNEILSHIEVPVVFITAYPERLLTGLRPEPTFVLTKPFKAEMVAAVVSQALFFESNAQTGSPVSDLDPSHPSRT